MLLFKQDHDFDADFKIFFTRHSLRNYFTISVVENIFDWQPKVQRVREQFLIFLFCLDLYCNNTLQF